MEAMYQIGKEIGELAARVGALETRGCRCRGDRKPRAGLPKAQQAMLAEIEEKHSEIVAGFNEVLRKLKLHDRIKVGGINLVDGGVRLDDEEQCCMCCKLDEQSGWQYCCDYSGCSTCC